MARNPDEDDIIEWLDRSVSERDINYDSSVAGDMEVDENSGSEVGGEGLVSESEDDGNDGDVAGEIDSSEESSVDGWVDITEDDDGPVSTIQTNINEPGPVLPQMFDANTTPLEYFSLFFNEILLDKICEETNDFANNRKAQANSPKSRFTKWSDMKVPDLKALLGVVLNMGIHPRSALKDYFSVKWAERMQFFGDVFSQQKFLLYFWNLHFSHEIGPDRDLKIRLVVNHLKEKCMLFYNPSSHVAVAESTISFKGRVVFRVYNSQKPVKLSLKVYVLSDSNNGYVYNFMPYIGKQEVIPGSDLLKTTQIVSELCESLIKDPDSKPVGHHVYVDRYYNSPQLAEELRKKEMYITGTVMQNRKNMPKFQTKKMKKGDLQAFRKQNVAVLCWKDKRPVTMITTKHCVSKTDMSPVPSRFPDDPPTMKPNCIVDYNKHMGGVDRSDHYIANYQFMRRSRKWYRKMFFWLLEVSVVNSYILYKEKQISCGKRPMKHKAFRVKLIEQLVAERVAANFSHPGKRRPGRPAAVAPEQRLNGKLHLIGRDAKSHRCHVCSKKKQRKETIYYCKTCVGKPFLHPDSCFEAYHTLKDYVNGQ